MKKHIPYSMRSFYHLGKRLYQDLRFRRLSRYAQPGTLPFVESTIEIRQAIKKSHLYENKLVNIRLAAHRIESLVVLPGQFFSFWKAVGKPTAKNGFLNGRNIIDGKLSEAPGGGLCQISGAIYHLALLSGFEIIERYNHSIDIYTDQTRYSPPGLDATVVYPQKDVILRNPYNFAFAMAFQLTDEQFFARVHAAGKIEPAELCIKEIPAKEKKIIEVGFSNKLEKLISEYKIQR